jgi:hypothetical protein
MYSQTHQSEYEEHAITSCCAAVTCPFASASQCFDAACIWAEHADGCHDSALEAYQRGIDLLPHLAMFKLDLQSH